jgi:hypothetical protein
MTQLIIGGTSLLRRLGHVLPSTDCHDILPEAALEMPNSSLLLTGSRYSQVIHG